MRYRSLSVSAVFLLAAACSPQTKRPSPDADGSPSVIDARRSAANPSGCAAMAPDHDALFARGTALIEPYMTLTDRSATQSSHRDADLYAGIACLTRVVRLNPANWRALWIRGKAQQALGNHSKARDSFRAAYAINHLNLNVGRELELELLELGEFDQAVSVATEVATRQPRDGGLQANLALALVLNGDISGAQEAINQSLALEPDDPISSSLKERIDEVAAGTRPAPKSIRELER